MGASRGHKIKALGQSRHDSEENVFWMSLEEAKRVIAEQYDYLADRYDRRYPKHKQA